MPNQMMPKVNLLKMPDPAAQTAKYVNMMNMAKQQEAAERQAQMAQETLTLQKEKGAREAALQAPALDKAKTDAQVAQLDYVMKFFKATANDLANSTTPEQAVARGERLKQQFPDPALQARINETIEDLVSDPSQFEAKRKTIILRTLDAKDQFAETHSDIFDAEGNLYNKKTSPVGAFPTEITPGVVTGPADTGAAPAVAPRTPVAPQTPTGPARTGNFGGALVTPEASVPLTPYQQDHIRSMQKDLGMANSPASFTRGGMNTPTAGQMSPDMVPAILDSAVNTGVMAQIDLDQMLAMAPPQAKQRIMDVIRSNNISLQADAPSLATSGMAQQQPMAPNPVQRPQSQFADMRGAAPQASFADLGGQPAMQNTMAQYQVGQQIKGRNQNVSPYPGSAQVPIERVRAEAQAGRSSPAEEAAKKRATTQVEIDMAPDLAKATKGAERIYQLKSEAPKERNVASRLIANIDDRIETIERLLRNPDRRLINGPIEGNLPYRLQFGPRADAQADFDKIKNTDTLTSLVEMKQDSPTGGSPVGNASNSDVLLVAKGANSLIQTGTLPKMDEELKRIRAQLYRTRSNVIKFYNDTYGDVVAADPRLKLTVPAIADRYISSKDLAKPRTSTKVDRNNPLLRGN